MKVGRNQMNNDLVIVSTKVDEWMDRWVGSVLDGWINRGAEN